LAELREAARLDPENPGAFFRIGRILDGIGSGSKDEVRGCYETALRLAPERLDVRREYGLLLVRARGPEAAIRELETVLSKRPDDVTALTGLAEARIQKGLRREAEADLRRALAVDADRADVLDGLALLLSDEAETSAGRRDEAVALA